MTTTVRGLGWAALGAIAAAALVITGPVPLGFSAADTPASLDVRPNFGLLEDGKPYSGSITASAGSITGCYRWVVDRLPAGLRLDPEVSCAPSAVQQLRTDVTGQPTVGHTLIEPLKVTISVYAVGSVSGGVEVGQKPLGQTTIMLYEPDHWTAPQGDESYANSALSLVSCPDVSDCWVLGSSSNPPADSTPAGVGQSAQQVAVVAPGHTEKLSVIAGGTFLAKVDQLDPLRLNVVRTAIQGNWVSLSCPSPSTCLAAGWTETKEHPDQLPSILRMADNGRQWSLVQAVLPSRYRAGEFKSISCLANGCVVVGFVSDRSNASDGYTAQIAVEPRDMSLHAEQYLSSMSAALVSVSCTNNQVCVAVGSIGGDVGALGSARILVSPDSGATWRIGTVTAPNDDNSSRGAPQPWMGTVDGPVTFGTLTAVGCAPDSSGDSCAALWPGWYMITNTSDGVHWLPDSVTQAPYSLTAAPVERISCPSRGHCFMITNPPACVQDHCSFVGIMESIPSGSAWAWGVAGMGPSDVLSSGLKDISCPTVTGCVAVGLWKPKGKAAWSPVYPLLITPQHATDPFFVAPKPAPDVFLTLDNLALLLGVVSLIIGAPAVLAAAPGLEAIGILMGGAGAIIGTRSCSSGDSYGCGVTLVSFLGLFSFSIDLAATILSVIPSPTASADISQLDLPDWLKSPTETGGVGQPRD